MTEFEKKMLLSEKAYWVLITWAGTSAETVNQTNYYYDTKDGAFYKRGITCRIREKNATYVATVKEHKGKERSEEYTKKVENAFDTTLFAGLGVSFQGSLKTTRTIICRDDGVKAMLDKNEYLDTIDYELEIEYSEGYEKQAKMMEIVLLYVLSKYGDPADKILGEPPNKSSRFLQRKFHVLQNIC